MTTGLCGPYNAFVIKKVKACIGSMTGVCVVLLTNPKRPDPSRWHDCAMCVPTCSTYSRYHVELVLHNFPQKLHHNSLGPYHRPQRAGHCPKALHCGPQGCASTDYPNAAGARWEMRGTKCFGVQWVFRIFSVIQGHSTLTSLTSG